MKKEIKSLLNDLPLSVKTHIEHLERVRRDFIANVSHELRTPLTVIHGYLETLLKENNHTTPLHQKIFTQMYQHSIRMETIIDDLLLLARLENEDEPHHSCSRIDISAMLHALHLDFKMICRKKKQKIHLHADSRVFLEGSDDELKSLFSNLIINAIKYTPDKGQIDISWYADEQGNGIFCVKDNGIGIAADDIPRITERFYRVDKSRSRESGGTGLGLAIAKHVLVKHHGHLQIESTPQQGSTFTCLFPPEIVTPQRGDCFTT